RATVRGIYRRQGEFWTIGLGGRVVYIRGMKGLGYVAHLLRHPNVEFHALDLFAGILETNPPVKEKGSGVTSWNLREEELQRAGLRYGIPADAGEMLDDEAKASYKRRLIELRESVEDAREIGNTERIAGLENEIDALARELSRAVGLGGRNRRA